MTEWDSVSKKKKKKKKYKNRLTKRQAKNKGCQIQYKRTNNATADLNPELEVVKSRINAIKIYKEDKLEKLSQNAEEKQKPIKVMTEKVTYRTKNRDLTQQ